MTVTRAVFALVVLDVVLVAPAALALGGWTAFAFAGDLAIAATLAVFLPRGAVWAATATWCGLFAFQCSRLGSILAMGEEGLLFDLGYLLRHTLIFGTDLIGWMAVPAILGGLAVAVGVGWTVHTLFGLVRTELTGQRRWAIAVIWALAALGPLVPVHPLVTWIVPVLVANLRDSAAVYREAEALVVEASRPSPGPVAEGVGPDLQIYVIESYGSLLFRDPAVSGGFLPHVEALDAALAARGWASVSALSKAPVSGGRSWIADASVMLGVPVAHESSYQHLMARIDRLNHLPGWLHDQGWHTVLCRPKDRARPGVEIENPLRFDTTVFNAELGYEGPHYGWGWIPDQYTLGFLREEVLPKTASQPTFMFVHLASAHVPWKDPPPVLTDWRGFVNQPPAPAHAADEDRELDDELGFTANRFRRGPKGLGPTLRRYMGIGDPTAAYAGMIAYDVDVIRDHLLASPTARPVVVVVMGDHQPPGIARRNDFTVPVHVFASDPALLVPLDRWGFTPGVALGADTPPTLGHQDLYEALAAVVQR
ncbi:MAG: hypothetical protein ABMB14_04040 [Myxococcota bacterium]